MPSITPYLWFDNNAEEAMNFYTSIFKDSKVISRMPGPNDTLMGATFELIGQRFIVLNAGPQFKFTEAISFFVDCQDQAEVDYYWDKLVEGGEVQQCGWLKDKFGLSWQIIPEALSRLMGDPDPVKAQRVMQAMLQMQKIIVADLEKAHKGE